jgi:hypothetical protein
VIDELLSKKSKENRNFTIHFNILT